MKSLPKSGIVACLLALSVTSVPAQAFVNTPCWYLGFNTGASEVNNQAFSHYESNRPVFIDTREESVQSGYNLGAFVGWNLYSCAPFLFSLELSADYYSNRGHYTIDFVDTSNFNTTQNLDVSYDMEYTIHLTARPGFLINDTTLFYFQIGAAFGQLNAEVKNLLPGPAFTSPTTVEDDAEVWGATLGTGIQKQLSQCVSIFAAYEYTYFGRVNLSEVDAHLNLPTRQPLPNAAVFERRESSLDINTFKAGVIFTF